MRSDKHLSLAAALCAAFVAVAPAATAKYGGGTGEPNDPYLIYTAEHLNAIGADPYDWDNHFRLMADIDLSEYSYEAAVIAPVIDDPPSWVPRTSFDGVFDGNGHTISHLTITGESFLGLFGRWGWGAKVSNLSLESVDVNGAGGCVGGLVGFNGCGSILAVHITGTVTGRDDVGGLVGTSLRGTITQRCSSIVAVGGSGSHVGGLVGSNHGSISASCGAGAVDGEDDVGGLVGYNAGGITSSYSTGAVRGRQRVGGLLGYNHDGIIVASYSTATVRGRQSVGGLTGSNSSQGGVTASYSTGTVSGREHVGGLVGSNGGYIATSYSSGEITGNDYVGGLVGSGSADRTSTCFWDAETSGQATSAGGVGLTRTEMETANIFLDAGWDFVDESLNGTCDQWQKSPGGYPRLRCHVGDKPIMPDGLGTADEPYLIRNARDLGTVWFEPTAHYRLAATVDLSGTTWAVAVVPWFDGKFDGAGYRVCSLRIRGAAYLGLFGQLHHGASVHNLVLEAVDVEGTGHSIGGLVGRNYGSVMASCSTGAIAGNDYVGGLAGRNYGSVTMSYSAGAVGGMDRTGGLVGYNRGSITLSYTTSAVSGDERIGGLVGFNHDGRITASYSTGRVRGDVDVGGLVGSGSPDHVSNSFWDNQTSGQATSAGGTGLATVQMQTASTFFEWGVCSDEGVWTIDEGNDYARLWWEDQPGQPIKARLGEFLTGEGTQADPYLIYTAEQLNMIGLFPCNWAKRFKLMADIDLSAYSYDTAVIAPDTDEAESWFQGTVFTGVFDGNGHTISNLTITGGSFLALFGAVQLPGEVKDVGLVDVNIIGSGDHVGGLAGYSRGRIETSYITGTVTGEDRVGGLVGLNNGAIAMSYSAGAVAGIGSVGGFVGTNDYGSVTGCYSAGTVAGDEDVGGLVGGNMIGSIVASFWDVTTSGLTGSEGGSGKTTAEMQMAATFLNAGWDFVDETYNGTEDIWWIDEGQDYPRLWWERGD